MSSLKEQRKTLQAIDMLMEQLDDYLALTHVSGTLSRLMKEKFHEYHYNLTKNVQPIDSVLYEYYGKRKYGIIVSVGRTCFKICDLQGKIKNIPFHRVVKRIDEEDRLEEAQRQVLEKHKEMYNRASGKPRDEKLAALVDKRVQELIMERKGA